MAGSPKRQGPPISFLPVSCNTKKRHEEKAPSEKKLKKKRSPLQLGHQERVTWGMLSRVDLGD